MIWVSFNGEIFNYIELREELIAKGHRFRTKSDTEVIIHLYEEMGPDCVQKFNGDFAFALFDHRRNQLMLTRDRMGVRPLFTTWRNGCLYFASEIKALLQVPGLSAELDPFALDQIFSLWFPLAPRTPFKNISELPPAHTMIVKNGQPRIASYWQLDYPDADEFLHADQYSEHEFAEELESLLIDAIRLRLRADVPVGSYLSGGLDSSILTSAAGQMIPAKLKSFSVTFEEKEFDESDFQQKMVAALHTQHQSVPCSTKDIGEIFPNVIRSTERPILRTAPAPLFKLSQLVHQNGFKVVLTGEGADEIFAGYDIFKEAKLRRFCAAQPTSKHRPQLFKRLYPYLPHLQGQSPRYLQAFFRSPAHELHDPLFSHLPRFRSTAGTKLFFSENMRTQLNDYDALEDLRDSLPSNFMRWHALSQAQYLEAAHLLPGYILSSQGDRVAMAHSIEGRFPFLDHRIIEFAARIPPRLKILGLREKHILRRATSKLMPAIINDRPKQPYRAPDAASFTGNSKPEYVTELLSGKALASVGYFDSQAVGKLLNKSTNARLTSFRDNAAFVGILSTQLWHKEFIKNGT
jgi:asparagine synthase (glutamine-hydrolysing)